jgi:predicted O-methyltransferase YrrM
MFDNIPQAVLDRMRYLEGIDARDRMNGTPSLQRLRQIPSETGKFIALLAATAPNGICVEIGTSGGYSTLWLALACTHTGRKIVTFEILKEKGKLAAETFRSVGVQETVELVVGDAREHLHNYKDVSFCFLDADKEVYYECYEKVIPNMVSGGLLIADNVISHKNILQGMVDRVSRDKRVDSLVVPIGSGELVCRKI